MVLMGWLTSDTEVGLFRMALASVVLAAMPVTILHVIIAPDLSKFHRTGQHADLQRLLSWASAAMVLMLAPIILIVAVAGLPLIDLIFGPAYREAWLPLLLLCIAQLGYGLFGMGPVLLAMCDGERHLIKVYAWSVGLGLLAGIPLIRTAGASGAATAMIISSTLVGAFSWVYGKRRLTAWT